jgi:Zn finger protein HypA/HybF involved in hydrogenase expression
MIEKPEQKVECAECGLIHKFSERLVIPEQIIDTVEILKYVCPLCQDESYIRVPTMPAGTNSEIKEKP